MELATWKTRTREPLPDMLGGVDREAPYRGPTFGLFDETRDLRPKVLTVCPPNYLFGPYRQDQAKFSCVIEDPWGVVMLLRILAWRA